MNQNFSPPAEIAVSDLPRVDVATCAGTPAVPVFFRPPPRSDLDIEIDMLWRRLVFATTLEGKLLWGERYVAALKRRRAAAP